MAFNNVAASFIHPNLFPFPATFPGPRHCHTHLYFKLCPSSAHNFSSLSSFRAAAQSEGIGGEVTKEEPPGLTDSLSTTRTQLDLLEQLTSTSSSTDGYLSEEETGRPTIREQLYQMFGRRGDEEFTIPLGKNLKKVSPNFLTISQKRNIKRQAYLNNVSTRNDTNFFATIGAFVILPPILILGVALLTGYVQFFP